jgi:hypothetical protein
MSNEKNIEHAAKLRQLADVYDRAEEFIPACGLTIFADTKESIVSVIRAVGGKFRKRSSGDNEHFLYFDSERIPGLSVNIWRDLVCRKIVRWECDPVFSADEEDEIVASSSPQPVAQILDEAEDLIERDEPAGPAAYQGDGVFAENH